MADAMESATKSDLASRPVEQLLVEALDRRMSAELSLTTPTGRHYIVQIVQGAPVKVRADDDDERTGAMLIRRGLVTEADVGIALADDAPLGEALVRAGLLTRERMDAILEEQFAMRVRTLFNLPPDTTFVLKDGLIELSDWGFEANIDPFELIWSGIRAHGDSSARLATRVGELGRSVLRLHPRAPIARFRFGPNEMALVELLRTNGRPYEELEVRASAAAPLLRKLVYVLDLMRHFDAGPWKTPIGVEPSTPSRVGRVILRPTTHRFGAAAPDPPGRGGDDRVSPALARTLSPQPGPALVGRAVPSPPASKSSMTASTSAEVEPSKAEERGTVRMDGADPVLASGVGPHTLLAMAADMLLEGKLHQAMVACERACRAAPADPAVLSRRIYIMAQLPGANLELMRSEIDDIIASAPEVAEAFFTRGYLRKRLGDTSGAAADLGRALQLDPGHELAGPALEDLRR